MRQRVGTTPDATIVLTRIADVLLQVDDVTIMQSFGHAIFNTHGITLTKIAFSGNATLSFEMDAPERAGIHTHFAAVANCFINHDRPRYRVPADSCRGTDLKTISRFALLTGQGKNCSLRHINMNPDIGVFAFEPVGILKRTNPLTVSAGQATILFNYDDFHSSSYLSTFRIVLMR